MRFTGPTPQFEPRACISPRTSAILTIILWFLSVRLGMLTDIDSKLQTLLYAVFIIYYLLNIVEPFAQINVQNYTKDKFVKLLKFSSAK